MMKKVTLTTPKETHTTFWLSVLFSQNLLCVFRKEPSDCWLWQNATVETIFANICWPIHPCSMSQIGHLQMCLWVQRERGNLVAEGVWLILTSLFRATWWRNTLKLTVVPKSSLQTEHCRSCGEED